MCSTDSQPSLPLQPHPTTQLGRPQDSPMHLHQRSPRARWATVAFWLSTCKISSIPPIQISKPFNRKCPEIPVLQNYQHSPSSCFWKKFPKFRANRVRKRVKSGVVRKLVQKCWFSWTCHQRKIAKHALKTVTRGAQTALKFPLPELFSKNAKSAFEHGSLLTDTIAQCPLGKKRNGRGPV